MEETAKGNWSGALGLGALGVALSIGIVPVLIIILGILAVGITLTVYFLPIILAGVVGVLTFYISREAGLTGIKLVGATIIGALGSLVLFSFTDLTLWGMNLVSPITATSVGKAQFLDFLSDSVRLLQLVLGIVITGFVLLMLTMIRSTGEGAIADSVVGLIAAFFVGIVASSLLNFQIPGLAEGISTQALGLLVSGIIGFSVGIAVMYSSWRWD